MNNNGFKKITWVGRLSTKHSSWDSLIRQNGFHFSTSFIRFQIDKSDKECLGKNSNVIQLSHNKIVYKVAKVKVQGLFHKN